MFKNSQTSSSSAEDSQKSSKLSPSEIYNSIKKDGLKELCRPVSALIFSGISAGLFISFSFLFTAVLTAALPDEPWSALITSMGYTVGFIIIILGHLQLFTENTITTVIPLFQPFTAHKLYLVARLWLVVFISNIIGTTIAALFLNTPDLFEPAVDAAMLKVAEHVASQDAMSNIIKGIPAGILISALVWIMANMKHRLGIIFFVTYLMALGSFSHVIVGSAEMAYAVLHDIAGLGDYFLRFLLPTALGNIIGGTLIFTLMIHGQVSSDSPQ
ncbi:formate/nitrite transporter family protein [Brackiella oedipodis]|uniref:formate/nitrite transporter family protein n=1 Tax=Brackiella oedipodis TaxID=124225 RepID=UPI00048DBA47|nr:formate/nitrite transporter family protein [Brackiella oedipodis]